MIPKTFSSKEDGGFHRWNFGHVDMQALAIKVNPDNACVYVNGVSVFSLYFEDDAGVQQRWNCKFGWMKKGML